LRGEGTLPFKCRHNEEKSGDLCFRKCKKGYSGAGPLCLQNCPPQYTDTGNFCEKPLPYGRGPGFLLSQKHLCKKESATRKCERFGELYYAKCKPGYHAVGCCVCTPNCEQELTCARQGFKKKSYGRGPGKLTICEHKKELFEGLCYKRCKDGFTGVGSVCWGECPKHLKRCGFFCVKPTCALCHKKEDKILREIGLLIHFLIPGAKNGWLILQKELIFKHALKRCEKLGKKKKHCIKKLKKLLEVIPTLKGNPFKLPLCHKK
jgi:hypothetical protein